MNRYICIHGHFYQPPRENPWLGEIERQDSAYPYHDWNERVTAECYAPNSTASILGPKGKIAHIMNNYAHMSFNFGPTLLSWMARHEPEVYQAILSADELSKSYFGGHGSALAQCYNHMIMPLASSRDKYTQVLWGIKDFQYRFKRKPEGMWLPETAVDTETLQILAGAGISFTILAPRQAKRARKIGDKRWREVSDSKIDPRHPYRCTLPSGDTITLFFYDGPASQGVAFEGLLHSGEHFAGRLLDIFHDSEEPQLVHIATDGETYGHHHPGGDLGLAYCINHIRTNNLARITIYGEYLKTHPVEWEVEIYENSSWSCVHGVERWRSNCGCNSGGHPQWNQEWRAPLRAALDWLRDRLETVYEQRMQELVKDLWEARNEYINVVLDRSPSSVDAFLKKHSLRNLSKVERTNVLKLLEMERQAMLMYTSCGWFFDEVSGIETIQIILYAARAIQLARESAGVSLEDEFVSLLEKVPSNLSLYDDAAKIYKMFLEPAISDLNRVAAHYAISSLFEEYTDIISLYCYTVEGTAHEVFEFEKNKLAFGKAHIISQVTQEEVALSYAVIHLGDHNFLAGVGSFAEEKEFLKVKEKIHGSFEKGDIPEAMKIMKHSFPNAHYTLWHLFKDEQRKILYHVLSGTIADIAGGLKRIKDQQYPMLHVFKQLGIPLPTVLASTLSVTLNIELMNQLSAKDADFRRIKELVIDIKEWGFPVDKITLEFQARQRIEYLMKFLKNDPPAVNLMEEVIVFLRILSPLELPINLWKAQNLYLLVGRNFGRQMRDQADRQNKKAQHWMDTYYALGESLKMLAE